jgi:hypothetical protein
MTGNQINDAAEVVVGLGVVVVWLLSVVALIKFIFLM